MRACKGQQAREGSPLVATCPLAEQQGGGKPRGSWGCGPQAPATCRPSRTSPSHLPPPPMHRHPLHLPPPPMCPHPTPGRAMPRRQSLMAVQGGGGGECGLGFAPLLPTFMRYMLVHVAKQSCFREHHTCTVAHHKGMVTVTACVQHCCAACAPSHQSPHKYHKVGNHLLMGIVVPLLAVVDHGLHVVHSL